MIIRRKTPTVRVGNVCLGSGHPIAIQSMTNTPTWDIPATFKQTCELIDAGSELVRWTVDDHKAAAAVPEIIKRLRDLGYTTPMIGDFHYNGHILLRKYSQTARLLDKYRINPGNVGRGHDHDENFETIIRLAKDHGKPVRIGANRGSLDKDLLTLAMARNAKLKKPKSVAEVMNHVLIQSVLLSAQKAMDLGLPKEQIVVSAKVSQAAQLVGVSLELARQCDFVLHLGLTEAGSDIQGITSSAAALGILLYQGIGDTIRVSLTTEPGLARTREVQVSKAVLQSLGLRHFSPHLTSCPGCGRAHPVKFPKLVLDIRTAVERHLPEWKRQYPGCERMTVAVMGCVVNGPGESREADIGISFPGNSESASAQVFIHGKKAAMLKGGHIDQDFIALLNDYLAKHF